MQRFCNAMEPGTYVRPHQHPDPGRWELFLALRGAACVVVFEPGGTLLDRVVIEAHGPRHGAEIAAGEWHTVIALVAGTVLFEVKPGPYRSVTDKDFAPWAPPEEDMARAAFVSWFREGTIGSKPPANPQPARC